MVTPHLADAELVWGWRLRIVLAHQRPARCWREKTDSAERQARQERASFGVPDHRRNGLAGSREDRRQ
jgi:hypothetical protein